MLHELRIQLPFLIHILEGKKSFEIRRNDRDFQVGDQIRFLPLENFQGYNVYQSFTIPLPIFEIQYILFEFKGLKPGYVGLSIKPVESNRLGE